MAQSRPHRSASKPAAPSASPPSLQGTDQSSHPLQEIGTAKYPKICGILRELSYPFVITLPKPLENPRQFKLCVSDIDNLGRAVYGAGAYEREDLEALCRASPGSWLLAYAGGYQGQMNGFAHVEPVSGDAARALLEGGEITNERAILPENLINDIDVTADTYIHVGSIVYADWAHARPKATLGTSLRLLAGIVDRILTLRECGARAPKRVFTVGYPVTNPRTGRLCRNASKLLECTFGFDKVTIDVDNNPVYLLEMSRKNTPFTCSLVSLVNAKRAEALQGSNNNRDTTRFSDEQSRCVPVSNAVAKQGRKPTARKHVFLSYCRDNKLEVAQLREELVAVGVSVWWDQDILPGQDWKLEIRKAMRDAYAVVLCLSEETSARVTSGLYPEVMDAIAAYREYSSGSIFLIPVRLSDCEIPLIEIDATRTLDRLQFVDLFPPARHARGFQQLVRALEKVPLRP